MSYRTQSFLPPVTQSDPLKGPVLLRDGRPALLEGRRQGGSACASKFTPTFVDLVPVLPVFWRGHAGRWRLPPHGGRRPSG